MKAKIGNVEIEGTPEEVATLLRTLRWDISTIAHEHDNKSQPQPRYVSSEIAFKAIKRRPLSSEQTTILKMLNQKHPDWASSKDLQEATNFNANQLAGIFGAFGKRVSATEGYERGTLFFEQQWDYDKDCYIYRLPQATLEAVKRAGL
jgi:hypothetical protein